MSNTNHIRNVAIVGAGGNSGSFMTKALLETGKHAVTAITRSDSQSTLPKGVVSRIVDYDKPETIVEALRGQDALVITISGRAPIAEIEEKLVRAAGAAGVPWILPNEWSPDTAHEGLVKDVPIFGAKVVTRKLIEEVGKSSYIAVVTGFWYEWTLAMPPTYGFDFSNRTVTFFDEGEAKISTSTWPQIGGAVASLLSLPVEAEGSNGGASLENFRNKVVYVNSFTVSQKDMLDSVLRVTGTKIDDWTIGKEPVQERYSNGLKELQEGRMSGYLKMCCRIFFPDGCGNFEQNKGTLNDLLKLPKEDIDEATSAAIKRSQASKSAH